MRIALAVLLAALSTPAIAGPLTLTSADGVSIHADTWGRGAQGVLLVHGRDHNSTDWQLFAEKLAEKGFRVLAVDLRGHGKSKGDATWASMIEDVKAGVAWLKSQGAKEVAIVGGDVGANLAVNAAAADPSVTNLVLVSPGLNIEGLKASTPLMEYGARPVLLVAGDEDEYAVRTVNLLEKKAAGTHHKVLLPSGEKGTRLFFEVPAVEGVVIGWLEGKHAQQAENAAEASIHVDDAADLESQGKRFGEE